MTESDLFHWLWWVPGVVLVLMSAKGMWKRKRIMPPNGSALQDYPVVWSEWKPEFGNALRRK